MAEARRALGPGRAGTFRALLCSVLTSTLQGGHVLIPVLQLGKLRGEVAR